MSGATYSYSSRQVTISVGGSVIDGGYGDGEFLRIEPEADDTIDVVGTAGDVALSVTNDLRATATIILLAGSEYNDVLSALRTTGRATPAGVAPVPFFVEDRLGRGIWEAPVAWIQRPPIVTFDRQMSAREWVLRLAHLRRVDGGNIRLE